MLKVYNNSTMLINATINNTYTYTATYVNAWNTDKYTGMSWECYYDSIQMLKIFFEDLYPYGAEWNAIDEDIPGVIKVFKEYEYDTIEELINNRKWYYNIRLNELCEDIDKNTNRDDNPIISLQKICHFFKHNSNVQFTINWMPTDFVYTRHDFY